MLFCIFYLTNGCPQVLGARGSRPEGCTPDNYAHFLTEWYSNYLSSDRVAQQLFQPLTKLRHLIPLASDKGGYPQPPSPQASK
jgi:hypothetical protein